MFAPTTVKPVKSNPTAVDFFLAPDYLHRFKTNFRQHLAEVRRKPAKRKTFVLAPGKKPVVVIHPSDPIIPHRLPFSALAQELKSAFATARPKSSGLADEDLDMFGGLTADDTQWATASFITEPVTPVTLPTVKQAPRETHSAYEELDQGLADFGEKLVIAEESKKRKKPDKKTSDKQDFHRVMERIKKGPTAKLD